MDPSKDCPNDRIGRIRELILDDSIILSTYMHEGHVNIKILFIKKREKKKKKRKKEIFSKKKNNSYMLMSMCVYVYICIHLIGVDLF